MSTQSFADLGVSRAVVDALVRSGITEPFAGPAARHRRCPRRPRRLVKSPTGSGKTLAFGIPIAERIDASRATPRGARPRAHPRAREPDRRRARAVAHARALRICAVYGGVGLHQAGTRCRTRAHPRRDPRPPARTCSTAARSRSTRSGILVLDEADRMLDMGFRPAVDRIVDSCPDGAPDAVLLGDARRRRRPPRRPLHASARSCREHGPRERRAAVEGRAPFVAVTGERRVEALVSELRGRARARARLRAHQARRRPARQAPGRPRRRGRSRCTATSPSASASRRSRASSPATSTRWSRPTSPRAGSTSTASPT